MSELLGPDCDKDHCARKIDCKEGECVIALRDRIAALERERDESYDIVRNWMLRDDSLERIDRWMKEGGYILVAANLCRALHEELYAHWNPSDWQDAARGESDG